MQWSSHSSAALTGHIVPRRQHPADYGRRLGSLESPASVNSRIWASRIQAQRQAGLQHPAVTSNDLRTMASSGDYGAIFDRSEEIQAEMQRKKRMAGPDAPLSWRRAQWTRSASASLTSGKQPILIDGEDAFKPATLRDECLVMILKDLALEARLIDEIPMLPAALKETLVNLASRIAPLDDISAEALLGDPYAQIEMEDLAEERVCEDEEWEGSALPAGGDAEGLDPVTLDLSRSRITVVMLSEILVTAKGNLRAGKRSRFPSLRALDLSFSTIRLAPSFMTICASLSLHTLKMVDVSYALATPLAALAEGLPTLRNLDLSENAWLEWQHLADPDWSRQWTALATLRLSGCKRLAPQPSFMDPEGTPGSPAAVVQALSLIREAGRKTWLDIIM